jgi:hypothetical protein
MNIRIFLMMPPPPRIIVSCMGTFVQDQLSSPDSMRLMIDLLSNVGCDLKGIASRLAKREGIEDDANAADADRLLQERQIEDYRQKMLAAIHERDKKRKCIIM